MGEADAQNAYRVQKMYIEAAKTGSIFLKQNSTTEANECVFLDSHGIFYKFYFGTVLTPRTPSVMVLFSFKFRKFWS